MSGHRGTATFVRLSRPCSSRAPLARRILTAAGTRAVWRAAGDRLSRTMRLPGGRPNVLGQGRGWDLNDFVIVTCEHGGNRVPAAYARLFRPHRELLQSHRGHDPGSRPGPRLRFAGWAHRYTLRRSRGCWSSSIAPRCTGSLLVDHKIAPARRSCALLVEKYYLPYRRAVTADVEQAIASGPRRPLLDAHLHSRPRRHRATGRRWAALRSAACRRSGPVCELAFAALCSGGVPI